MLSITALFCGISHVAASVRPLSFTRFDKLSLQGAQGLRIS
jgi:hypothetical protein